MRSLLNRVRADLAKLQAGQDDLHRKVDLILEGQKTMADVLAPIRASVVKLTSERASLETFMTGISAMLKQLIANSGNTVDPADVAAIAQSIDDNTSGIAADILANTPSAGTAAPNGALSPVVDANNQPVLDTVTGNAVSTDADGKRWTTDANGAVVPAA